MIKHKCVLCRASHDGQGIFCEPCGDRFDREVTASEVTEQELIVWVASEVRRHEKRGRK